MHLIRRPLLRRHLKRMVFEGLLTPDQFEDITDFPRRLSALNSKVDAMDLRGAGRVSKLGDGAILKFLWERRQEILAFVKEIIRLFS